MPRTLIPTSPILLAPANSASYGALSLGSIWDGASAGHFSGAAAGTLLAMNAASGFTGDFARFQVAGVDYLQIRQNAGQCILDVGVGGSKTGLVFTNYVESNTGCILDLHTGTIIVNGAAASDIMRWLDPSANLVATARVDGLFNFAGGGTAGNRGGCAVLVKAGAPADADWTTAPPVGTIVLDTTNSKIWLRTAAATWKGVAIA